MNFDPEPYFTPIMVYRFYGPSDALKTNRSIPVASLTSTILTNIIREIGWLVNKIVGSVTELYGSLPCLAWQFLNAFKTRFKQF